MIRTGFVVFVAVWTLATILSYALTLVLPAVEAVAVAFVLGVLVSLNGKAWRGLRRLGR